MSQVEPSPGSVVYVARHGQIRANLEHRYAGNSTEPLTQAGRVEALDLAERLRGLPLRRIVTSEVARAVETAEVIAVRLGLARPAADPRLNELQMGPWEGMTEDAVAREFPDAWLRWNTRPDLLSLDGRETLDALAARAVAAIEDASRGPGPVLLVTHVAPIRVAALRMLDLPLSLYKEVPVANADCLAFDPARGEVTRLGGLTSLREELVGRVAPSAAHEAA